MMLPPLELRLCLNDWSRDYRTAANFPKLFAGQLPPCRHGRAHESKECTTRNHGTHSGMEDGRPAGAASQSAESRETLKPSTRAADPEIARANRRAEGPNPSTNLKNPSKSLGFENEHERRGRLYPFHPFTLSSPPHLPFSAPPRLRLLPLCSERSAFGFPFCSRKVHSAFNSILQIPPNLL